MDNIVDKKWGAEGARTVRWPQASVAQFRND